MKKISLFILISMLTIDLCSSDFSRKRINTSSILPSEVKRDASEQEKDAQKLLTEAAKILGVSKDTLKVDGIPDTKGRLVPQVRYLDIERISKPKPGKLGDVVVSMLYGNRVLSTGARALYFDIEVDGRLGAQQKEKLENLLNSYVYQTLVPNFNYDARLVYHHEQDIEEMVKNTVGSDID